MKNHKLTLKGGSAGRLRVPATVLQETIAALIEGAQRATRFVVEGESVRRGTRPGWLDSTSGIEVTGLSAGSAIVTLDAPTLAEADVVKFGDRQPSLFHREGAELRERTAIDLFGAVLASVIEGETEDVLADRPLLDTCARLVRALQASPFTGLSLEGLHGRREPLNVGPEHLERIELLRDETPSPQAVRLSAVLDTISVTRTDVTLTMKDGTKVAARLEEHDHQALRSLWGETVVVSGMARYRPSGRLLLIDVESIRAAADSDSMFEVLPVARARQPVVTPVPQGEDEGVAAFFGTWPGDESDDELLAALQAIG